MAVSIRFVLNVVNSIGRLVMFFDILLYASLMICFIGISYRIFFWTKKSIGYHPSSGTQRLSSLIRGVVSTLFSLSIFRLVKSLIFDVLLQGRILKTSLLRWVMHILMFIGFTALIIMHALDAIITENLFTYYYSTINPFFFLRSLFGLMVLLGIIIAILRRYIFKPARLKNAKSDLFALILVFIIILSGIALEGIKMTSVSEFTVMVEDYAGLDYEDEDIIALETYWVKEFALVSARIESPFDSNALTLGLETHETNCMDCHSPNKSAFLGYIAAKMLSPVAIFLDKRNGVSIFYYFHIISCFLALALVPFSKMFHMVATPISLFTNAVKAPPVTNNNTTGNHMISGNHPMSGNQLTKQLMELDACTHCSTCNLNCSAGMIYEAVQNDYILPSQKILALKKAANGQELMSKEFTALFQGLYLCTNCDRCTVVCPSGIHLKSLWISSRENLIQQNLIRQNPGGQNSGQTNSANPFILTGFSFVRGLNKSFIEQKDYNEPLTKTFETVIPPEKTGISDTIDLDAPKNEFYTQTGLYPFSLPQTDTFSHCFGCRNCSTICPVVADFDHPQNQLTLMPHQIMYSMGLGMVDLAKDSAMIWNCLGCYQCQENCPQNVNVCDILFALKNKTFNLLQESSS
ncbi:MAG: 4Fe-4S dicluster domain-containing protein [Desulfobacula sp.]|nr:4Fe-4S dicluster domain-containing protein [Desulfobacula sp.]